MFLILVVFASVLLVLFHVELLKLHVLAELFECARLVLEEGANLARPVTDRDRKSVV